MAAMVPTRTANPTMHVIAANICADQRAEIAALNGRLTRWGAGGSPAMATMAGMVDQARMTRLASLSGPEFDRLWLSAMICQHQGRSRWRRRRSATAKTRTPSAWPT